MDGIERVLLRTEFASMEVFDKFILFLKSIPLASLLIVARREGIDYRSSASRDEVMYTVGRALCGRSFMYSTEQMYEQLTKAVNNFQNPDLQSFLRSIHINANGIKPTLVKRIVDYILHSDMPSFLGLPTFNEPIRSNTQEENKLNEEIAHFFESDAVEVLSLNDLQRIADAAKCSTGGNKASLCNKLAGKFRSDALKSMYVTTLSALGKPVSGTVAEVRSRLVEASSSPLVSLVNDKIEKDKKKKTKKEVTKHEKKEKPEKKKTKKEVTKHEKKEKPEKKEDKNRSKEATKIISNFFKNNAKNVLSLDALKNIAKAAELPVGGNKDDLCTRIAIYFRTNAPKRVLKEVLLALDFPIYGTTSDLEERLANYIVRLKNGEPKKGEKKPTKKEKVRGNDGEKPPKEKKRKVEIVEDVRVYFSCPKCGRQRLVVAGERYCPACGERVFY